MRSLDKLYLGTFCSVLALSAGSLQAREVTIQTVDGNISIQGTIVSFDGENYELDSAIGRTRLPIGSVICLGEACPVVNDGSNLSGQIGVLDAPSLSLFKDIVGSFATAEGFDYEPVATNDGSVRLAFTNRDGRSFGELAVTQQDARQTFEAMLQGDSHFVMSASPIDDGLADALVADGHPDLRAPGREVIVALDAIVPVVHPSNNIRDLSLPTLGLIAAGRIENWNELGGPDLPIRMVLADEGSSIYGIVDDRIMRPNRIRLDRDLETVTDEAAAAAIVSADPGAITLTSAALAGDAQAIPIRQVCGPLSIPSTFSVTAEEYPLARRIYIYTSGDALPESVKDLLAFSGSSVAQAQFVGSGFVGQTVETVPMSLQGSRLASAILFADTPEVYEVTRALTERLTLADRLSTTFRFEAGSTDLDNKSRRDAVRIAEHLLLPENADREILLFGFTDSVGRNDLNALLSLQQAISIQDAIISASQGQISADRIDVTSYGQIAPVGCNETVEGRNSNRRVEVWLR